MPRHLTECYVRKNDVRRHAPFLGQTPPQLPQAFEENLVASNFAGAMFDLLGSGHWLGERDALSLFQRRHPFSGQFDDAELISRLTQISEPDQLTSHRLPFRPAVFLPNS